ncbi:enoyl-CoA hydratase-related protein [Gordonia sp. PP30]|uniref:enoyl-CoA hydratase-related protein n=1 Tax=Gordonia sp. PP30 TaxID=2935861 RepID=UPI001FFF3C4A|nr:enoyl-CoA hydratase-related protein [Gordonia sp. PP30]UQE75246.1 enoyl-CoA hydratase-related protein [Gordonia sp. PP30]
MNEVTLARSEAIATVTLNRPEAMNAMNDALLDQLVETLESLDGDDSVRVIVLRGAGRAFCVGGDLTVDHTGLTPAVAESRLRAHVRAAEILREGHAVSIAAVDGAAAGAGFSLAAACDLRVIAESAVFRAAFVTAAMSGDFGLSWSLTRLIGSARAHEILLLNEKITAARAVEIGLASGCVADDAFEAHLGTVAATLAGGPPLALGAIKANLNDATQLSFTECLRRECTRHVATGLSADATEAGRAFLEKRRPEFHGR